MPRSHMTGVGGWLARGGRFTWNKHPAPASPPVPAQPPAPGCTSRPQAVYPPRPAPAPGHDHGEVIRQILVYSTGHTEITRWPGGGTETITGDCPACAREGACTLCGFWPHRRSDGRWVRRHEKCPLCQDKERQL